MYKIEFTLKQHTPIIHFQHFLSGATLRSTELKSALDKFIIGEKCGCWSTDKTDRLKALNDNQSLRKWLKHATKPTHPSFDYDVELIVLEPSHYNIVIVSQLKKYGFFGNQPNESAYNDQEKYKKGIIQNGFIKLIFKSPYQDLLTEIDKYIAKFFLIKNFGTRQSKGFGCFFPIEKYSFLQTEEVLPYYFDYDRENMEYEKNNTVYFYELFEVINLFYNTLRSGINIPNNNKTDSIFYFKSLMWSFAKSKNEHWDKKSIKNQYKSSSFGIEDIKWKGKSSDYNTIPSDFPLGYTDSKETMRHLWRDCLGLSTDEKWGVKKVVNDNSKFTRFKSPIIFKPILVGDGQYRVFFGVRPDLITQFKAGAKQYSEAEILGKQFKVKFNGNGNLILRYPDTFDYAEYLKFAINKYNSNSTYVESRFHDTNEFKIIDAIYKQLNTQVK